MNQGKTVIRLETADEARLRAQHSPAVRDTGEQLCGIRELFSKEASLSTDSLARYGRAWTRSHLQDGDVRRAVDLADRARDDFDALVTVGVGGSDLSARVFHDVLNPAYHNLLTPDERGGAPEVYFAGDTFDPRRLRALLGMLDRRGGTGTHPLQRDQQIRAHGRDCQRVDGGTGPGCLGTHLRVRKTGEVALWPQRDRTPGAPCLQCTGNVRSTATRCCPCPRAWEAGFRHFRPWVRSSWR